LAVNLSLTVKQELRLRQLSFIQTQKLFDISFAPPSPHIFYTFKGLYFHLIS
jgi:hypothetical protein